MVRPERSEPPTYWFEGGVQEIAQSDYFPLFKHEALDGSRLKHEALCELEGVLRLHNPLHREAKRKLPGTPFMDKGLCAFSVPWSFLLSNGGQAIGVRQLLDHCRSLFCKIQ
jgi:hypothetical protein